MSERLKVVVISRSFRRGGSGLSAGKYLDALAASHFIDLVCVSGDDNGFCLRMVRLVERLADRLIFGISGAHFFRFGPHSVNVGFVKNLKPTIIQLFDISSNTVDLQKLLGIGVPIFLRLSDMYPFFGAFHYPSDRHLTRAHAIFCKTRVKFRSRGLLQVQFPSKWLADLLRERLNEIGVKESQIFCLPNIVPKESKRASSSLRADNSSVLRLAFISQDLMEKRKRLDKLLEVCEQAAGKIDFQLFLLGKLEVSRVRFLSQFSWINWIGPLEYNAVLDFYRQIDVVVHFAVEDNSPNAVTDGLCFGVPAIVVENSGAHSYIYDKKNGRVLPEEMSSIQFFEALQEISDNKLRYKKYAENLSLSRSRKRVTETLIKQYKVFVTDELGKVS